MNANIKLDYSVLRNEVISKIQQYAQDRASDIRRNAETPRLAALLVEKYVWGCYETLNLFEDKELKIIADEILKAGDSICNSIDSKFKENKKARWASRPADLDITLSK